MKRIIPTLCATILLASAAFAQGNQTQGHQTPAPGQAGDDPSMAQPQGSNQSAVQAPQPVHNPESTDGLAPADQPINNIKPRVAGEVVPSSQETAAHNASIFAHDKQPILTHTFNFTAEQKRMIVDALAQEKGGTAKDDADLEETAVVPASVSLKPIPDRIAQEMPWVKPYYYVKTGERIAIVNPLGRYVASVIE